MRFLQLGALLTLNLALMFGAMTLAGCKPNAPQVTQTTPEPIAQIDERADPIAALANLSDPEKLKTLKPEARSVNGRMDKILYWLFVAEQKGIPAAQGLNRAFDQNRQQNVCCGGGGIPSVYEEEPRSGGLSPLSRAEFGFRRNLKTFKISIIDAPRCGRPVFTPH